MDMQAPGAGHPGADREWQDALAIVERDLDTEALAEAHEVYLAEASRIRLRDRRGRLRLVLASGAEFVGDVGRDDPVAEHWVIVDTLLTHVIAERAIMMVTGSRVQLRSDEEQAAIEGRCSARSLASWLREVWLEGRRVEVLTATGARWAGSVTFVGADHVELSSADSEPVVMPFRAVDVWSVLA